MTTPGPSASRIADQLSARGWAFFVPAAGADLEAVVNYVARSLGTIAARPGRSPVETLAPKRRSEARASSLSARFGLARQPLHNDTAHWPVPCRYVVLACRRLGNLPSPTLLLDARELDFSAEEKILTRSAVFCVRNGKRSFYASIADGCRPYLRVDPGCMEPLGEEGERAMGLFEADRFIARTTPIDWKEGTVLVLDNWRVLHGRGNSSDADENRCLLRSYVW